MKKILIITMILMISTNVFALSKQMKYIISTVLILGGSYAIATGMQTKTIDKADTVTNTTVTDTESTSATWGSGYTSTTHTTSTDTTINFNKTSDTRLNDINLAIAGLALIAGGVFSYIYITPDTAGVQIKF